MSNSRHTFSKSLLGMALVCGVTTASAADLIISEYIEGSSYNKAIEIYNGTGSTVDLSSYELQFYFNGSVSAGRTISLSGTLPAGEVYVISHSSADPLILAQTDLASGGSWFNGNDAVMLLNGGSAIDVIGQVGVDPGVEWGTGDTSTQDNTLIRNAVVCSGDANAYDSFNPSTEWTGEVTDTFSFLGSHNGQCGVTPPPPPPPAASASELFISEYIEGSSYNKAVEIYNGTGAAVNLTGYELQFFFNGSTVPGRTITLSGSVAQGDVYVIAHSSANAAILAQSDLTAGGSWFNGDDVVALLNSASMIDVIGEVGVDPGSQWGTGDQSTMDNTIVRNPTICAGDANAYDSFDPTIEWTGYANDTFSLLGSHNTAECGSTGGGELPPTEGVNKIHIVQGSGLSSPLVNQIVTLEAVVVADFQGANELGGFYIQEEDVDADPNAATSEGIFVSHTATAVNVGDLVTVTGTVAENFSRTQINSATVNVVSTNNTLPTAATVNLPFSSLDELEAFEGMRVTLPQTLTVTENYNLARFGEIWLSSGGRLMNPTNVVLPGAAAIAQKAANDLNRILLDDASTVQNPASIIYPAPGLSAANTLRSGDTTSNLTGVLDYAYGSYRVQPTATPLFTSTNLRTSLPVDVGGSLKVVSFNVLNYFNGDGSGGGFPTARGADTYAEYVRQHDKIIAALNAIDGDIIGLMEIENDGYGSSSAINQLVAGLNAVSSSTYAYVNPGVGQIGTDQIAVGFIYKTNTVSTSGAAKILDSSVDSRFDDTKNRPALAQTFVQSGTGAKLTIAVNHLKSKGSSCATIGDPDTGDGQGNCNLTRTAAAAALVDWLATDPTNSNDTDFMIIGDLNAYAKEDPISTIKNGGYSDLIDISLGANNAYTYIFSGEAGYLDHALSSTTLTSQVIGTTIWHSNSDEPRALDYNTEFKTASQVTSLYNADAFRASDHDAVIVGVNLN